MNADNVLQVAATRESHPPIFINNLPASPVALLSIQTKAILPVLQTFLRYEAAFVIHVDLFSFFSKLNCLKFPYIFISNICFSLKKKNFFI